MHKKLILLAAILIVAIALGIIGFLFYDKIPIDKIKNLFQKIFYQESQSQGNQQNQNNNQEEVFVEENLLEPSAKELADFKKYTSEQFNYEIQYPKEWTHIVSKNSQIEILTLNSLPEPVSGIEGTSLAPKIVITIIGSLNQTNPLTLKEAADKEKEREVKYFLSLVSEKNVILEGFKTKKMVFYDGKEYVFSYVFLKDDNIFGINIQIFGQDQELQNTAKKAIATLNFLK